MRMRRAVGARPDAVPYTRLINEHARAAATGDRSALSRAFQVSLLLSIFSSLSLSLFSVFLALSASRTHSHTLSFSRCLSYSHTHTNIYIYEIFLTCMGEARLTDIRESHLCKNAPAVNAPSIHVFERRDSQRYVNHDSCAAAEVSTSIYPRVDTTRRTRTHWHTHIFLQVLADMEADGIEANKITYTALITGDSEC